MFDTMEDLYDYTSQAKAKADAGVISSINSKMPGSSHSTSTSKCNVGAKLSTVVGSVCHGCYAKKSERMYPSVKQGWGDNYMKATTMIATNPVQWAKAMSFQIEKHAIKNAEPFHRWFAAGDLASVEMLAAIVLVCNMTPNIKHWLPTREAAVVKAWHAAGGVVPANLVIRMSSTMVGDAPISGKDNTSTVHPKHGDAVGHVCPASTQGNACGSCRACWTKTVANVSYPFH